MSDLSVDTPIQFGPSHQNLTLLMDANQSFYAGAMIALDTGDGYAEHMDDEPGLCFMGIASQYQSSDASRKDNTNATIVNGNVAARIPLYPVFDRLARGVTVTGASARTDAGRFVYATDDATLTMTQPADDRAAVAVVWEWISGTTCDVLFFTPQESIMASLIGTTGECYVGQFNAQFGPTTYTKTMRGHGVITDLWFYFGVAGATGSSTFTIQASIGGGSNLYATAAIMPVASATKGAQVKASALSNGAITAANAEFHDGDDLAVVLTDGGTAMTAAIGQMLAVYDRRIGV